MAALTATRLTESKHLGDKKRFLATDSTQFYAGGMVMIASTGLALPAQASAGNNGVVGVAVADVLTGTGDYVLVQEGMYKFAAGSIAQGNVTEIMYAQDDQTFDETQGANEPVAGPLVEFISATEGWLWLTWKKPLA